MRLERSTTQIAVSTGVAAAHHAVLHPHSDRRPPAAVTDLAAQSLGDGRVRLTRTSPGKLAPAAAGTGQSRAVTGLSPGVYCFTLKTWDDGPNVSELSNVVQADVR
jgi:hypothetical protein